MIATCFGFIFFCVYTGTRGVNPHVHTEMEGNAVVRRMTIDDDCPLISDPVHEVNMDPLIVLAACYRRKWIDRVRRIHSILSHCAFHGNPMAVRIAVGVRGMVDSWMSFIDQRSSIPGKCPIALTKLVYVPIDPMDTLDKGHRLHVKRLQDWIMNLYKWLNTQGER